MQIVHEPLAEGRTGERGTTLVEVLVALVVLMILMIGVLQMFSVAYLVNLGSASRTEMTYKAQQALENMRYLNTTYKAKGSAALPANLSPVTFPLTDGASFDLSSLSSSDLATSYWGPSMSDVVETVDPRYAITIETHSVSGGSDWNVVVTVKANTNAGVSPYINGVGKMRVVEYASQIPN